ncbi:MAG: hypothetical protein HQM13_08590 [SAR324 cluster bacterium]|nr:hypothetical protein [SAR324 cluster bacterium]
MNKNLNQAQYFAAIDIGSNAVRMALAEFHGKYLKVTHSWRSFLRLGQDVFQSGEISRCSSNTLSEILEQFLDYLKEYSNIEILPVATSAMRDAKNQQTVIGQIKENLGLQVKVISGAEEADYILTVVQDVVSWGRERVILADLGGGSLEISVLQGTDVLFKKSFDWGVLRLLKLEDRPKHLFLYKLEQQLKKELDQYIIPDMHLILSGGPAKIWARLIHAQQFPERKADKLFTLSWQSFIHSQGILLKKEAEHSIFEEKLRPEQAEMLIPSFHIFEQIGKVSLCKKITVPFVGLKEGVLLKRVRQESPDVRIESQSDISLQGSSHLTLTKVYD